MKDGKVIHCWPTKYSCGNLETKTKSKIIYGITLGNTDRITDYLIDFAKKVIKKFQNVILME
jgi:hypothetical protein